MSTGERRIGASLGRLIARVILSGAEWYRVARWAEQCAYDAWATGDEAARICALDAARELESREVSG